MNAIKERSTPTAPEVRVIRTVTPVQPYTDEEAKELEKPTFERKGVDLKIPKAHE